MSNIPSETTPAISLIMPCYNRAYDLIKALRAYDQQAGDEPFELIAVDDGSSDATFDILSTYRPTRYQLRAVRQERNQGPAAARNRGITLARAPLILFVGDDILPHPDLVRGHLTAHRFHADPKIAILGRIEWGPDLTVNNLMRHIDGPGAEQFSYYYLKDGQEYDFRHLYTANISLKRDFLCSLDRYFDTDFNFAAFEDVELSYRLKQRGLKIIYSAHLLGYHYHYHNIWTFTTRQYRSGLMACVLVRKHPELVGILMGKKWTLRKLKWQIEASLQDNPLAPALALEDEVLHLANDLEAHPRPNGTHTAFFMGLLRYFYFKGLIYGSFGETDLGRRVHARYAQRTLPKLLAVPILNA